MMQRWEYLTVFLEADAVREEDYLRKYRDWKDRIPDFAVEALMPRLNALGEQGWELVSLEPVFIVIAGMFSCMTTARADAHGRANIWACSNEQKSS